MQSGADIQVLPASPYSMFDPLPPQKRPMDIKLVEQDDDDDDEEDDEEEEEEEDTYSVDNAVDIPRAASYTNLPATIEPSLGGLPRTFSENNLALPSEPSKKNSAAVYRPNKTLLRRVSERSIESKPQSTPLEPLTTPRLEPRRASTASDLQEVRPKSSSKTSSRSFRDLVSKTWRSPSRSPSRSTKADKRVTGSMRNPSPVKSAIMSSTLAETFENKLKWKKSRPASPKRTESVVSRASEDIPPPTRNTALSSKGRRPLSTILMGSRSESEPVIRKIPSLRSLKSNVSTERLSSTAVPTVGVVPPLPQSISSEKIAKGSRESAKQRDPLWGAFRALEGDYQKFQSKSSALKVNVIRSSLLTFLSKYASHPSNSSLKVEDLDRRIMILNKWWTGLMEILNGRNTPASIFGNDRPVFLEAVAGIMTRPEWRVPPLTTRPSSSEENSQTRRPSLPDRSTTSFESSGSDFLAESIFHNVRNLFAQNLLSQMAFVVERMSMKTAPASLVSFCGKTCAYAFFFCPDVADILTRLWTISPETLRRTLSDSGVPQGAGLRRRSYEIAALYPPAVRVLAFEGHAKLSRRFRQQPQLSFGAASVKWFGPWVNRWTGRESDLFFAFTKHYHFLVAEFLPQDFDIRERACVPGLVLVHAQLLTVLEATLYRQAQAGQEKLDQFQMALLDEIEGPDVPASLMPLTAANAVRTMAENRLIMLLRDLLADKTPEHHFVRQLYAISFDRIVKAAARRMSLYDNNACVVLCDFMEEVLVITTRYQEESRQIDLFDWPFWLEVLQKMMASHNTLTEIRVFAFVYNMWDIITENAARRRDFCLGWLLEPRFFHQHFNHWCPMVRQYYYRLLCWRIGRLDEDGRSDALEIVKVLHDRLMDVWAQYLFLRKEAEVRNLCAPSTAPCSPAPGRRIVIIRTDNEPLPAGYFMSFDSFDPSQRSSQPSSWRNPSMANGTDNVSTKQKRWSMLKSMVPFNTPGNTRPGEVTPPSTPEDSQSQNDMSGSNPVMRRNAGSGTTPTSPPHQAYSFKFSLEWLERPSWPSRNRQLSPPKLPHSAQTAVDVSRRIVLEAAMPTIDAQTLHDPSAKYSGRALAEWSQVVSECNGFFDRRRDEGVPTDRMVETPTLSVESFRMFG